MPRPPTRRCWTRSPLYRLDSPYDGDDGAKRYSTRLSQRYLKRRCGRCGTTGHGRELPRARGAVPAVGGIICSEDAHIENDEAGAPGFFTGGAKLIHAVSDGATLTPAMVEAPS